MVAEKGVGQPAGDGEGGGEAAGKGGAAKFLILLPPLLFLALAVLFYVGMHRDNQTLPSMLVGHQAPKVEATALGNLPILTDADVTAPGVKLVNFWASWCQPCRAEAPMLKELQAKGVTILGVNYKDKPDAALGFLGEAGNPYAKVGADGSGRMGIDWGIYGVPETFVIDGKGKVLARLPGPISPESMKQTIAPAMAQAAKD